jgi:hypothetical protein
MKNLFAHHGEDGLGFLERLGVSANHEKQLTLFCAPVAAGDRCVEKTRAAFGAGRGDPAGEGGRDSARVHVDGAAFEGLHGAGGAPKDFFESGRIADHGEEEIGSGGNFLRGFGEPGAGSDEFIGAGSGAVPDGERVAGFQEIHAHGTAHEAESDESDFLGSGGGFQRKPPRKRRARSAPVFP